MQTRFEPEKWNLRIGEALAAGKAFSSLILGTKEVLAEQVPFGDIPNYAEGWLGQGVNDWRSSAWLGKPTEAKAKGLPWLPVPEFEDLLKEFDALFLAHETYCTQAIVHASTLAEGMIVEFLTVLFENRTEQMYSFTGHAGLKGQISLKVVAQSESLQGLLNSLATQAAARVFQQPYPKMLKTLERLSGVELSPKHLGEDLLAVFEVRNNVVHEPDSSSVTISDARTAHWTIQKLCEYLLHSAMMNEFPVSEKAFSDEERENKLAELAWGHKGQWPGEMQWVKISNEDLRPEVLKRFGEDIEEIVPWDEGVFLGDSLLRAATTYLERAYYFDTSSRNIHVNYPDSFPDTETTHVDADGLLAIEKDWESPPKESKP